MTGTRPQRRTSWLVRRVVGAALAASALVTAATLALSGTRSQPPGPARTTPPRALAKRVEERATSLMHDGVLIHTGSRWSAGIVFLSVSQCIFKLKNILGDVLQLKFSHDIIKSHPFADG